MACYIVPAAAFVIHKIIQRKNPKLQTQNHTNLSLLLGGGAIFGLVDHAWNGELLFGKQGLLLDLALGVAITVSIFTVWGIMVFAEKWRARTTVGVKE